MTNDVLIRLIHKTDKKTKKRDEEKKLRWEKLTWNSKDIRVRRNDEYKAYWVKHVEEQTVAPARFF